VTKSNNPNFHVKKLGKKAETKAKGRRKEQSTNNRQWKPRWRNNKVDETQSHLLEKPETV
jgi:hypothetical protein